MGRGNHCRQQRGPRAQDPREAASQPGPGRRPGEEGARLPCRLGGPGTQAPRTEYNGAPAALTLCTRTELGKCFQTLSFLPTVAPREGQFLANVPAPGLHS